MMKTLLFAALAAALCAIAVGQTTSGHAVTSGRVATSGHVATSGAARVATSGVPAVPATTAVPAVPATTAVPAVPATTHVPAVPATTAAPVVPATTAAPAVPATTGVPAVPATTAAPAVPATTAAPAVPATTAAPAVPATTAAPAVPATTAAPAVPATTGSAVFVTTAAPAVPATTAAPAVPATTAAPAVPATTAVPAVATGTTATPVPAASTSGVAPVAATTATPVPAASTSGVAPVAATTATPTPVASTSGVAPVAATTAAPSPAPSTSAAVPVASTSGVAPVIATTASSGSGSGVSTTTTTTTTTTTSTTTSSTSGSAFIGDIFPAPTNFGTTPAFGFVGDNTNSPTWNYPVWSQTGGYSTCAQQTYYAPTTPIPFTTTVASVYQISILFTYPQKYGGAQVFIVTEPNATSAFPFNGTASCSLTYTVQHALTNQIADSYIPNVNEFVYLPVGSYHLLIVATDIVYGGGPFAVNIFQATAWADTTVPAASLTTAAGTTGPVTSAAGTTAAGTTAAGTTAVGTTAPATTAVGTTAPATSAVGTSAAGTTATTGVPLPVPASNATFYWYYPESTSYYAAGLYDAVDEPSHCYSYGEFSSPFKGVTFTATGNISGFVDILVGFSFVNNIVDYEYTWTTTVALYQNYVNQDLLTAPTYYDDTGAGPCNTNFQFLGARQSDYGRYGVAFYNFNTTPGATYTLIVSGGDVNQTGQFGVFVQPTIIRQQVAAPTVWTPPYVDTIYPLPANGSCPGGQDYTDSFYTNVFTAQYSAPIIIDVSTTLSSYDDTYNVFTNDVDIFFYAGNNSGNATQPNVPQTCPTGAANQLLFYANGGEDGYGAIYWNLTTGAQYTAVFTPYEDLDGEEAGYYFSVYSYTGYIVQSDGSIIAPAGSTTGSGSSGNSGSTGNNANAASSVVVNVAFMVLAAIAAVFMA